MGPAVEISGGSAANTLGRRRVVRRPRRVHRPGRRRPARRGVRARPPRRRRRVRRAARGRRRAHRPLPRHRRRPTRERTMNTYLGASARARPGRRRPRPDRGAAGHVPRGLPLGRAGPRTRYRARRAHRARGRPTGSRSRSPTPFCVDRHRAEFLDLVERDVDILFANEAEISLALRGRRLRRRAASACSTTARSPRSRAAQQGSVIVAGDERARGRRRPGRRGRRHDRRRRPVRRRVPLRPHPRATTSARAAGSARSRRPR